MLIYGDNARTPLGVGSYKSVHKRRKRSSTRVKPLKLGRRSKKKALKSKKKSKKRARKTKKLNVKNLKFLRNLGLRVKKH